MSCKPVHDQNHCSILERDETSACARSGVRFGRHDEFTSAPDYDGSYTITWSAPTGSATYVLQERVCGEFLFKPLPAAERALGSAFANHNS